MFDAIKKWKYINKIKWGKYWKYVIDFSFNYLIIKSNNEAIIKLEFKNERVDWLVKRKGGITIKKYEIILIVWIKWIVTRIKWRERS